MHALDSGDLSGMQGGMVDENYHDASDGGVGATQFNRAVEFGCCDRGNVSVSDREDNVAQSDQIGKLISPSTVVKSILTNLRGFFKVEARPPVLVVPQAWLTG